MSDTCAATLGHWFGVVGSYCTLVHVEAGTVTRMLGPFVVRHL